MVSSCMYRVFFSKLSYAFVPVPRNQRTSIRAGFSDVGSKSSGMVLPSRSRRDIVFCPYTTSSLQTGYRLLPKMLWSVSFL